MNLIVSKSGTRGSTGVALLLGSWNCLAAPPNCRACGVSAHSWKALAWAPLRAPFRMPIEPISAPLPSAGVTVSTGMPCSFSPGPSCTKLIDTVASPRATALIGPVPDRVY